MALPRASPQDIQSILFIPPQQFQGPVFVFQEGPASISQFFRRIQFEKLLNCPPLFFVFGGQQAEAQNQQLREEGVLGEGQPCQGLRKSAPRSR